MALERSFDTVQCRGCGHQNSSGLRYCASCGLPLIADVIGESRTSTSEPPRHSRPPAPAFEFKKSVSSDRAPLQANSKKCQSCGTRASELQQFCAECGAKLLQPAEVNPAGGSIRPVESARPVEAVAHQISPEPAPIAKAQVSEQPQQGPPAVKASALDAAGPVSFDPICRGCGSAAPRRLAPRHR